MQTKSVKSVSMPDTLWADLDNRAEKWGGNRSAALTRIYLEWLEMSQLIPTSAQATTPKKKTNPATIAALAA